MEDLKRAMYIVGELGATAQEYGQAELAKEIHDKYNEFKMLFLSSME